MDSHEERRRVAASHEVAALKAIEAWFLRHKRDQTGVEIVFDLERVTADPDHGTTLRPEIYPEWQVAGNICFGVYNYDNGALRVTIKIAAHPYNATYTTHFAADTPGQLYDALSEDRRRRKAGGQSNDNPAETPEELTSADTPQKMPEPAPVFTPRQIDDTLAAARAEAASASRESERAGSELRQAAALGEYSRRVNIAKDRAAAMLRDRLRSKPGWSSRDFELTKTVERTLIRGGTGNPMKDDIIPAGIAVYMTWSDGGGDFAARFSATDDRGSWTNEKLQGPVTIRAATKH